VRDPASGGVTLTWSGRPLPALVANFAMAGAKRSDAFGVVTSAWWPSLPDEHEVSNAAKTNVVPKRHFAARRWTSPRIQRIPPGEHMRPFALGWRP
jgi:hypothetical protein